MASQEGRQSVLQVELVTPTGPAYVDDARMVVVPGSDGELGVLPRHAPLVAQLDPGETRVRALDDSWIAFATGPGYFKVQHDVASILVSSAVRADQIDVAAAERDRDAAQARLDAVAEDETGERRRAERALADAENRLRVAGRA
jgi:F-type H+-transporting ATPase subunit epsilon